MYHTNRDQRERACGTLEWIFMTIFIFQTRILNHFVRDRNDMRTNFFFSIFQVKYFELESSTF